jgi:hypothetical protein
MDVFPVKFVAWIICNENVNFMTFMLTFRELSEVPLPLKRRISPLKKPAVQWADASLARKTCAREAVIHGTKCESIRTKGRGGSAVPERDVPQREVGGLKRGAAACAGRHGGKRIFRLEGMGKERTTTP